MKHAINNIQNNKSFPPKLCLLNISHYPDCMPCIPIIPLNIPQAESSFIPGIEFKETNIVLQGDTHSGKQRAFIKIWETVCRNLVEIVGGVH